MQFRHTTLSNGLEVVAETNNEDHTAAVAFVVKTGARDETPEASGVSHFLEHMAFKGTPTRTAEDVNRQFDAMGAENNAYTSKENTVYWAAMLPEYVRPAMELLADILRPSLREEDFDLEKQVILEEIRMYEDQPPYGADEKCEALHFGSHPLAHSVLGSVDSVGGLSVEAMQQYFLDRYSPQNIALAGAGAIDWNAFVDAAETYTNAWQPQPASRRLSNGMRHLGFHVLHKPQSTQQYVVQLAAAPCDCKKSRYAADLATTILGDSTGSRLYWELLDSGEAEQAGLYYVEYQSAGIFWTVLSGRPENAAANLHKLHGIYADAQRNGFTATELDQAKNKSKSRAVLIAERPARRLFYVAGNWVQHGEYQSVRDELAQYDAVTLDDVNAVLSGFPLTVNTTVTIGPLENVSQPTDV